MMNLNCLLKDKCLNIRIDKCSKCIYNRDNKLEDNFKEKVNEIDDIRTDLKNQFDNDMYNYIASTIDDGVINKIISQEYNMSPYSVEALMIKAVLKGLISGDENIINEFINPEDKDEVLNLIKLHKNRNPFINLKDIVDERKQAKGFENNNFHEKIKKRINSEYGFSAVNRQKESSGVHRTSKDIVEKTNQDALTEYFKNVENSIFRK